jgi:hypothetical protein
MSGPVFGGCACGAIRYCYEGEPLFAMNCHCRDCQRETGSAYAAVLGVPAATFKVTEGSPKFFDLIADSGNTTRRGFCADCGSPVFGLPGVSAEMVTIRAGSLDDPSSYRPTLDVYVSRAQPWDHMNPDLPKASKLPER